MASKPPKETAPKKSAVPPPVPVVENSVSHSSSTLLQRFQTQGMARLSPADVRTLHQTVGNRALQRIMTPPTTPVIQRVLSEEEQVEKQGYEARIKEISLLKGRTKFLAERDELPGIRIKLDKLKKKEKLPSEEDVLREQRERAERLETERREAQELQMLLKPINTLSRKALRTTRDTLRAANLEMQKATGYDIPEQIGVAETIRLITERTNLIDQEITSANSVETANSAKSKAEQVASDSASLPELVGGITTKVEIIAGQITSIAKEISPTLGIIKERAQLISPILVPVITHAVADKNLLKLKIQKIVDTATNAVVSAKKATKIEVATQAKLDVNKALADITDARSHALEIAEKEKALASDDTHGGHVVGRHGPEIDSQKILDRLVTNIAPDGKYSPAGSLSSQFTSYAFLNNALTTVQPLILAAMKKSYQKIFPKLKAYKEAKEAYESAEQAVATYVPVPVLVTTPPQEGSTPTPPVEDPLTKLEKERDDKAQEMGTALANVQNEVNIVRTTAGHCQAMFDGSTDDPAKLVSIYGEYQIVHDHGSVLGKGYRRGATDVNTDAVDLQRTRTKFAFDSSNSTQFLIGGNLNVDKWIVVQHFPTDEATGIL